MVKVVLLLAAVSNLSLSQAAKALLIPDAWIYGRYLPHGRHTSKVPGNRQHAHISAKNP
ncbi:hypothetical protein [Desulfosarcina widdelii]|uniref:hypothetical protein n=1 Tax=Desulfosarcina widdelii TaxID=947919 RepID=UPI0012D35CCF|nr:hypothetical protein [Desulfosarcina widdelii]